MKEKILKICQELFLTDDRRPTTDSETPYPTVNFTFVQLLTIIQQTLFSLSGLVEPRIPRPSAMGSSIWDSNCLFGYIN
jgi:hypothetical protein